MERQEGHTETNLLWKITEELSAVPPPKMDHGCENIICHTFALHSFITTPEGDCCTRSPHKTEGLHTAPARNERDQQVACGGEMYGVKWPHLRKTQAPTNV